METINKNKSLSINSKEVSLVKQVQEMTKDTKITLPISYKLFEKYLSRTSDYNHFSDFSKSTSIFTIRRKITIELGFMSPIIDNIDSLAKELSGYNVVYDVGAGSGYFTNYLSKKGINILAYDLPDPTYEFKKAYSVPVVMATDVTKDIISGKPDAVILSWPDYDTPFGFKVAKACLESGSILYYLGEGYGGCTGDDDFHDLLDSDFTLVDTDLNDTYLSYMGINDYWFKYTPNKQLAKLDSNTSVIGNLNDMENLLPSSDLSKN